MNPYIGHDSQLYGIEEHRYVGGKGDGLRLYEINNGRGLELTVSPDRTGDITRLRYRGINMSYMTAVGYVHPAYYDMTDDNWLRSFTAGFLTTCGLTQAGAPCVDEGEALPLHGTIANMPADQSFYYEDGDELVCRMVVKDETIFAHKLRLTREIRVSTKENVFRIVDTVENTGDQTTPLEILYHMNMGYPLLDEDSVISIPADEAWPRDAHAATGFDERLHAQKPTPGYQEMCYFYRFHGETGQASIYQPKLHMGLTISFNTAENDCFTQWKMMGVRDYVMGLECGNCYPDGRAAMREQGILKFIEPGEKKVSVVTVTMND